MDYQISRTIQNGMEITILLVWLYTILQMHDSILVWSFLPFFLLIHFFIQMTDAFIELAVSA